MLHFIAQTSQPALGMRQWTAEQWTVFFGAAGVFVTVVAGAIATLAIKVFAALKELRTVAAKNTIAVKANSQALVPLMKANDMNPATPDIDATVKQVVAETAALPIPTGDPNDSTLQARITDAMASGD